MDSNRFDDLLRHLVATKSRRNMLRLLGSTALGSFALLRRDDAAAEHEEWPGCTGRRCGDGRGGCCRGHKCCNGRCRNVRWDNRFCGNCRTACDTTQGEYCEFGECVCGEGVSCGDRCCQYGETCCSGACCAEGKTCTGEPQTCQACPTGANACDGEALACASYGYRGEEGDEDACYCVTSEEGTTACSSLWGFCAECKSDDECSFAMGRQAVCIPAAGCCADFGKTKACVEATCHGGRTFEPGVAAQGTEREVQLRPGR